jgi:hypothetical protein
MKLTKVNSLTKIILVFLSFIIFSCAPSYVPNVVNTPLFSNKGEFQASVNTGASGFDPQLAFAVTNHVGLMLNGSFASRTSDTTDAYHKHQFFEIGAGYYQKIGNNGRFEVFAGAGFGKVNAFYENNLWYNRSDVNNFRFFFEPVIGATTSIFDGSFTPRLVFVNLYQESSGNTGVFIEPAITAKFGYKYIKTVFQLGFSVPFNSSSIEFEFQPIIFSIGLQATLGKKYE